MSEVPACEKWISLHVMPKAKENLFRFARTWTPPKHVSGKSRHSLKQRDEKQCSLHELDRITFEPVKMGGRACIRGKRVTVSLIVNLSVTA